MTVLHLEARAKLNLVLRIVGRRPDGYHLLETLFHEIALCDDLWAERCEGGSTIVVRGDGGRAEAPAGPDNLVLRAGAAFLQRAGLGGGVRFWLQKRIPAGAGLGGGSSDAAAALRLCQALTGRPLDEAVLRGVAAGLGADVAFFLRGGSQWGRGKGDQLTAAPDTPRRHFVLVVPPFDCPTAAVYRKFAESWNGPGPAAMVPDVTVPPNEDSGEHGRFINHLESAAERVRPELAVLRARVAEKGYPSVRMTGSGSTLFVACADAAGAQRAGAALQPLCAEGVRLIQTRSADPGPEPVARRPWSGGAT